jgi:hypothetical protein
MPTWKGYSTSQAFYPAWDPPNAKTATETALHSVSPLSIFGRRDTDYSAALGNATIPGTYPTWENQIGQRGQIACAILVVYHLVF